MAFRAARETADAIERGDDVDPGDIGAAVENLPFRFTPRGGLFGSGTWRIDDIYVDPWKTV